MSYDPEDVTAFFDEYGEREWTRFEDGRTPSTSLAVHVHYLRRFVKPNDRVLDVGAGPGRFTLELGATIVVADISPEQLELNACRLAAANLEDRVADRRVADVTDLSEFPNGTVVAASAAGLLAQEPEEPELRELLARVELDLAAEEGAVSSGEHILAVLRRDG